MQIPSSSLIVGACLCQLLGAVPSAAQTQRRSEERLIQELTSGGQQVKHAAVVYVRDEVPAALRGPQLERALVDELVRLNEMMAARREADRAGKLIGDFPAEYHGDLIQVVAESSNAIVIPALAGALGTGRVAEDGLVRFGEAAVPATMAVGRSHVGLVTTGLTGDIPPHVVASALTTLGRILPSKPALSAKSRLEIAALARDRLAGTQNPSVIIGACRLAVATGDPSLRQRVQQLAREKRELQAMGVSDTKLAAMVARIAEDTLAGK